MESARIPFIAVRGRNPTHVSPGARRVVPGDGVEFARPAAELTALRDGQDFIHAVPDTLILPGDVLVVSGRVEHIEAFAGRN